jgi:predicted Zn-dependent protease
MAPDERPASSGVPRTVEEEILTAGRGLLQDGHVDEAIEFFRRMVRIFPESPVLCACLGEAYIAAGEVEKGQAHLARSRENRHGCIQGGFHDA